MFRKTTVELLPLEATKVEAAHGGKGAGADTVVDIKPVLLRVDPFLRRLLETAPLHERWSTRSAHIFYVSAAEACFTFLQSVVCTIVLQVVDETACLGYPIHLFIDGVVFFGYAWTTIFGVILFDMLYLCEVNIPFFRPHVLLPFLSMGFHAGYFILFIVGASYSFSALAHGTTATCNGGSPIVTFALAVVAVFFCSLVILIFVASRSWLRWKQRYEKPIYQPIDEPKQIVVLRGENAHDSIAASPSSPKETLLGQIEEPTEEKDGHVHAGNVVPVRVSVKHLQNPFLSPRPLLPESNAETHAELRSSATGAHADTDVTRHSHSRSHDQDQDHDAEDEDEHPNHWDAHSHQHQHQLPHSMRNDNQDQDDEDGSRRSDGGEQLQDAEALSENQQHSYVGGEGDVARGGGEHEEVRNGADSSRDGETEDNDCNNCDDDDDDDGDYRSRRRRAIPRPLAAARVRGWPPHSGQNASGKECNINAESDADGEEQQTREPSSNADARDVCDLMYEHQRREDDSSSALAAPDLEPELNADHNEEIASAATSRSRLLHRAVGPELGDVEDRHGGKEAFPQAEQSGAEHEDEDNDGPREYERRCDRCRESAASVRCDACARNFCNPCYGTFHHGSNRKHSQFTHPLRVPDGSIFAMCQRCEEAAAAFVCSDCRADHCSACDRVLHKASTTRAHRRTDLEGRPLPPLVASGSEAERLPAATTLQHSASDQSVAAVAPLRRPHEHEEHDRDHRRHAGSEDSVTDDSSCSSSTSGSDSDSVSLSNAPASARTVNKAQSAPRR